MNFKRAWHQRATSRRRATSTTRLLNFASLNFFHSIMIDLVSGKVNVRIASLQRRYYYASGGTYMYNRRARGRATIAKGGTRSIRPDLREESVVKLSWCLLFRRAVPSFPSRRTRDCRESRDRIKRLLAATTGKETRRFNGFRLISEFPRI